MVEVFRKMGRLKLGYLPTRRNSGLSRDEAMRQKDAVFQYITQRFPQVELVNIDRLNEEGILFRPTDAEMAADIFIREKVDAVFALHCNFGCEDAVAKVGKLVGKPLLLWGPRDEGPDGEGLRLRDTQCGLFATSKALLRYGVKFNYITNSALDSETFRTGFADFLGVASTVKSMKSARIGQIGVRPTPFTSVMTNESELLERFGIEVVPVSVAEISNRAFALMESEDTEYARILQKLKTGFENRSQSAQGLEKTAALTVAIARWAAEWSVDAVALQCWSALQAAMDIFPCVAAALLTEEGLPVSCETDINGAITLLILNAASMGETSVLADLTIRHPEEEDVELLWHCGNFPHALSAGGSEITDKGRHARGLANNWEIRGGDITVARFDGLSGKYYLLMGESQGAEGPANKGTYLWTRFQDWPEWENRFIYGPYIHHVGIVHGRYARVLYSACRYIDGLEADPVYPDRATLERSLIY